MKIYKIEQDDNDGYDTFDSAIVYANSEEEAKTIRPYWSWRDQGEVILEEEDDDTWTTPDNVTVTYIGEAPANITEKCVILASFNAG